MHPITTSGTFRPEPSRLEHLRAIGQAPFCLAMRLGDFLADVCDGFAAPCCLCCRSCADGGPIRTFFARGGAGSPAFSAASTSLITALMCLIADPIAAASTTKTRPIQPQVHQANHRLPVSVRVTPHSWPFWAIAMPPRVPIFDIAYSVGWTHEERVGSQEERNQAGRWPSWGPIC